MGTVQHCTERRPPCPHWTSVDSAYLGDSQLGCPPHPLQGRELGLGLLTCLRSSEADQVKGEEGLGFVTWQECASATAFFITLLYSTVQCSGRISCGSVDFAVRPATCWHSGLPRTLFSSVCSSDLARRRAIVSVRSELADLKIPRTKPWQVSQTPALAPDSNAPLDDLHQPEYTGCVVSSAGFPLWLSLLSTSLLCNCLQELNAF